jgi:hypothetical protein
LLIISSGIRIFKVVPKVTLLKKFIFEPGLAIKLLGTVPFSTHLKPAFIILHMSNTALPAARRGVVELRGKISV